MANLNVELPDDQASITDSPLFNVALADTGGLPGWVVELGNLACTEYNWKTESYVGAIHDAVKQYLRQPASLDRVKISVLVGFARPPLEYSSELLAEYAGGDGSGKKRKNRSWTVQNASDSGRINVIETANGSLEIRIPAAVMASYATNRKIVLPCDVRTLCCAVTKMDGWTWQRFQSAHICYIAAVLHSIAETKEQFWTLTHETVRLSNVLVCVLPSESPILKQVFTPQPSFDALCVCKDKQQCIPKSNAKSREHRVDTQDLDHMHQALDGTPVVDAYVNLKLYHDQQKVGATAVAAAAAAIAAGIATLFVQYKHSKLESKSQIKVSEMNHEVTKLETYLSEPGSNWCGRPWIFLWVSNRAIVNDVDPHPNLLWVGRDQLIEHAPLIGRRGLIPVEEERNGE